MGGITRLIMEVPFPLASSSDLISFLTFHISTCWSASLESAAAPILAYALRRCPRPASKLLRWSGENVPRLGDRPPFLADFLRKISRKFPSTMVYQLVLWDSGGTTSEVCSRGASRRCHATARTDPSPARRGLRQRRRPKTFCARATSPFNECKKRKTINE